MSRNELTREDRRRGGIRSGEVRRKKRDRGWQDAFLTAVDRDPEAFARRLLEAGNSMVLTEALKLAESYKQAELRAWEHDLEQREGDLASRANEVAWRERCLEDWPAWEAETNAAAEKLQAEVVALEQSRDELRAAIALEAAAADLEWVDDGEEAGDVVAST